VARIEIQSDAVNEERLVEVAFDEIPRDIHLADQYLRAGEAAMAAALPSLRALAIPS
jgi:hypothetical protein